MGYIVSKNGKHYLKYYINLCKMGIKNKKFSLKEKIGIAPEDFKNHENSLNIVKIQQKSLQIH